MKKLMIIVIFIMTFFDVQSQNMVYDGSFENYIHLPVSISYIQYNKDNLSEPFIGDMITNCLCHRPDSTFLIYPFDITRYSVCEGWFNGSHFGTIHGTFATGDYFHRDVNPSTNFGEARYADVPINLMNSKSDTNDPLITNLAAEPFEGDAYVGLFTTRRVWGKFAYTEYVAQNLTVNNPDNYLKEGAIYDISFRVKRSDNYKTTGHSFKEYSMFLWYDIPMLENNHRGVVTDTLQKNHFMVNEHNNPSGFIDDTNWVLVSERFTAPHDLNYLLIGSFDLSSHFGDVLLPDSLITPNGGLDQVMYNYIDSVVIDSVGFIDTCDCGDLNQDISFRAVTSGEPGECCRVIELKIGSQDTTCYISEFIWDKVDGNVVYDTVNINEIGHLLLANDKYIPVDTVCYDESVNGLAYTYDFKFRTFGSKEFRCTRFFIDSIDCYDLPCTWLNDSLPDPNEPSKQAVRMEITSVGLNTEGQCCYEIEFINNSPYKINANALNLKLPHGDFTGLNYNDYRLYTDLNNNEYTWYSYNGIDAFTSFKLGTICLDPGTSSKFGWKIFIFDEIENYPCMDTRYEEISCNDCCPDTEIFTTLVQDGIDCCITIDSLNLDCGDDVEYYSVIDETLVPVTLPFTMCDSNSQFKFQAKIYNHDTLYCIKYYDFNDQIDECSCCNNLHVDVMKDPTYSGSGCRYLIDRIYGFDKCNIDSTTAEIEYGEYVNGIYQYTGIMDYTDYDTWLHTMTTCEKDTLVFKFLDSESSLLCQKEIIVQCQTCEDLEIDSIDGYIETIYYGEGVHQGHISSCCIDFEVSNPDSGSCDYYGIIYQYNDIDEKINIYENQERLVGLDVDTLTICGATNEVTNGYTGTVSGYYAIYDSFGNLLCSFYFEHTCESPYALKTHNNPHIDLEQILVNENSFQIETSGTNKLNYSIYTLTGQLLYQEENENNNSTLLEINTANMTNGVYSVYIETDEGAIVRIFRVAK